MEKFLNKVILLLPLLFLTHFNVLGGQKKEVSISEECLNIHQQWLKQSFELTKNCVGFSAPVSARAYSYFAIGMYESTVEILPKMQSLSGQLNGFSRTIWSKEPEKMNWKLVVNSADYELLLYLYRNMPPANVEAIKLLMNSINKASSKKCSKEKIALSVAYGKSIAMEIIEWSKLDGSDDCFNKNYPENFIVPKGISCWTRTTPGYQPSLLPYWGDNRPFLKESHTVVSGCDVIEFSTESNSKLYQDALNLVKNTKSTNQDYEQIAEYWDDAPGYTGTPTGHFFSLARQLVDQQKLSPENTLELYVKLGVAINEAFIQCWRLKYTYNFIRPITYIHRYIDPQFNSLIPSPSFPEFPSGHSFQSGAGSEILKYILSDTVTFTDSTNINRSDIDGSPRSFSSFTALAEEISISRFYGGIHFMQTLDISLKYGRDIGIYVAKELKCRKN